MREDARDAGVLLVSVFLKIARDLAMIRPLLVGDVRRRSIMRITLTLRGFISERSGLDRASLRGILGSVAREQRGADERLAPRADEFRKRVKRGKEGLGCCVSLPPSGAHLPGPQQSRTVRSGQELRRRSQTVEPLAVSPTIWTVPPPRALAGFPPFTLSLSFPCPFVRYPARNWRDRSPIEPLISLGVKGPRHLLRGWTTRRGLRLPRRRNRGCTRRRRRR